MSYLSVFKSEWLCEPDDELGKLLLSHYIAANAQGAGLDPLDVPLEYAERVVELIQKLPDDHATEENDSLFLAIRLAAHGNWASAGKKFRNFMENGARRRAAMDMLASLDDDTKSGIKIRRSAKLGHEITWGTPEKKEDRRQARLALLEEIRRDNPEVSKRKSYELAAVISKDRLGEELSYKAFERAENKSSK